MYIPTEPRLGLQPIAVSSLTQNHDLGTLIRARDPIYGEGEFIYLLGVAGTAIGSTVVWKGQSSGTPTYQTSLAPAAANLDEPLAVAMSANVGSQYGWYQIGGQAVVATNGTLAANVSVYLAGSGQLTSTAALGLKVFNAVSITASGTPSSGKAVVEIDRPFAESSGTSVTPTLVTTATYTIKTTDVEVYVNFAGTVTLTLPDAASWFAANTAGIPLSIKDISGAASTNNITINRVGADTIDGATSELIVSDYGGFKMKPPSASGNWAIVG